MSRPDRPNEVEINLLKGGALTYLLGGGRCPSSPCISGVFWVAIPHQILDFEDTSEYFVATLPLAGFIQCRLPEQLFRALLQGELVVEGSDARAQSDLGLLAHWEVDLNDADKCIQKAVLLEIEARLLRLASSSLSRSNTTHNRPPLRGLTRRLRGDCSHGKQTAQGSANR